LVSLVHSEIRGILGKSTIKKGESKMKKLISILAIGGMLIVGTPLTSMAADEEQEPGDVSSAGAAAGAAATAASGIGISAAAVAGVAAAVVGAVAIAASGDSGHNSHN
jgi:hypothetical protein